MKCSNARPKGIFPPLPNFAFTDLFHPGGEHLLSRAPDSPEVSEDISVIHEGTEVNIIIIIYERDPSVERPKRDQ